MTLVVSLRVPDGVVLAADSLQTTKGTIVPGVKDLKVKVPGTDKEISLGDLKFPPISIPTSTSSYAQKLFPFKTKFGVATFGSGIINNRTIYNHIKNLESSIDIEINSVVEAAEQIKEYFHKQLQEQLATQKVNDLPEESFIVGFQVVGFESKTDLYGKTVEVTIGKNSKKNVLDGIGCTVSGDTTLVRKLWELGTKEGTATNYGAFSLQDAVDYSKFLIDTTSAYQRFANMIPTVGGDVDIALITNYSQFTWIRFKELTKIIEKI